MCLLAANYSEHEMWQREQGSQGCWIPVQETQRDRDHRHLRVQQKLQMLQDMSQQSGPESSQSQTSGEKQIQTIIMFQQFKYIFEIFAIFATFTQLQFLF